MKNRRLSSTLWESNAKLARRDNNDILSRAMISQIIEALETERVGRRGTGHSQFLDDRLILPPLQELVINRDLPPSSHVRLGIIRIGNVHIFYMQLSQH